MSLPNARKLLRATDATWPAHSVKQKGGWKIRYGAGGGKRVSATTKVQNKLPIIEVVEDEMQALGQEKLFMILEEDYELDVALETRGYSIVDRSIIYICDILKLVSELTPVAQTYQVWEPLEIMREIWQAGGIGDARVKVMDRVAGPKTGLLARDGDTVAGTAFVARKDDIGMVHAVEVLQKNRRKGVARKLMAQAASWAKANGAIYMSLMTTKNNVPANKLYRSMNMEPTTTYHYRIKES